MDRAALERFSARVRVLQLDVLDLHEVERVYDWIDRVDDPYVRRIFILRYVEGLTWHGVSLRLRGTSADSCRMIVQRYLKADAIRRVK